MLKKVALAAAFAASVVVMPMPVSASTTTLVMEYDPACLLIAGCFWDGEKWVCANPQVFMLCKVQD
jgi:hypothetical protein